jgi:hypothetical protein
MFKKALQQGRNERRGEAYSGPYVEPLSDARTTLETFFHILLVADQSGPALFCPDQIFPSGFLRMYGNSSQEAVMDSFKRVPLRRIRTSWAVHLVAIQPLLAACGLRYVDRAVVLFHPARAGLFVRKREDLPFHWMFLMFGAFILACGPSWLRSKEIRRWEPFLSSSSRRLDRPATSMIVTSSMPTRNHQARRPRWIPGGHEVRLFVLVRDCRAPRQGQHVIIRRSPR